MVNSDIRELNFIFFIKDKNVFLSVENDTLSNKNHNLNNNNYKDHYKKINK